MVFLKEQVHLCSLSGSYNLGGVDIPSTRSGLQGDGGQVKSRGMGFGKTLMTILSDTGLCAPSGVV